MLRKKKEKVNSQTIIFLIEQCNQNCLFCSGSEREKMDNREIRREILMTKGAVIFEGGEPTISKNLLNWIKVAKNSGVKEIVLVTNGVLLSSMDFAKKLINSGITLFNISFHSHRKSLYNLITQSDCYSLAIRGLKNLVWLGAAPKTRLTFVIAKVNYRTMPGYVEWVRKNFPGIFYIAFNYIKVLGKVKNNPTYYVP